MPTSFFINPSPTLKALHVTYINNVKKNIGVDKSGSIINQVTRHNTMISLFNINPFICCLHSKPDLVYRA